MSKFQQFQHQCESSYSDSDEWSVSDSSDVQDVSTYRWLFGPSVAIYNRCPDPITGKQGHNNVGDRLIFSSTDLSEDLRLITDLPDLCDVEFLVGKDREPVYGVKAVLASRSRCFYNLILASQRAEEDKKRLRKKNVSSRIKSFLKSNKSSKQRKHRRHVRVPIPEFDWCTFQRVVLYLHTGKIHINQNSVIGVLAAADMYKLDDLRRQCDQFARKLISVPTVLSLLMATENYSDVKSVQPIKDLILTFISDNAEAVLNLQEFEFVTKKSAEFILTTNSLQISDDLKWEATLRWTRRHCRGQSLDTFRETIKPFLSYINFNCVSVRKLTLEIRPLRVLNDEVISNAVEQQVKCGSMVGIDSPDVIYSGSPDVIGRYINDVTGLNTIDAIGSYDMADLMVSLSGMDSTTYGYQSFFNENDLLDELLEDDSDLSAIFDISMTSA